MLPPGSNTLSSPSSSLYGYHSIVMPSPFGVPPPPPPPLSKAPMLSPASMSKTIDKPFLDTYSTRRKTPMVHWGSAYMYPSPRDPNDLPNMWYSKEELHRFQVEKRRVIQLMQRVNGDWTRLEGIDCETRGFESYQSEESHRALRSRRRAVVHQVLKVQQQKQQQQQQLNRNHAYTTAIQKDDHEMAIAQSSRNESFLSQELAHQMGLKDELVAQMAWQEFFAELDDDDDELPVESEVTSMEDSITMEESISNTGFLDMGDIMDLMELDDE